MLLTAIYVQINFQKTLHEKNNFLLFQVNIQAFSEKITSPLQSRTD
jgi:hypothetical protein